MHPRLAFVHLCCLALACDGTTSRASLPAEGPAGTPASIQGAAPVARVETTDPWIDLIAQRPSAVELQDGAVVIDLGREHSRKHVSVGARMQWRLGQDIDGRAAGLVIGRSGTLDLPLDGPLAPALHPDREGKPALALAIELRSLAPDQLLTVLWNERPLANLHIGQIWERRTLSLPHDLVRPGENHLRLHFRKLASRPEGEVAAAVARVEVGTLERITTPPTQPKPPYRVQPRPGLTRSLVLPAGAGLAWYLVPPRRGRLRLDVRGRGALRVYASADADHRTGRAPTALFEEPLRPSGQTLELDLSAWGGVPIRLALEIQGTGSDVEAELGDATVIARRTVPIDRRARKPRDVVVFAIEGARADAFELGRRPPLLAFDELMAESLVFDRAYALSPSAIPSHASWWTSVAPPVNLTVRGTFVADVQSSVAEVVSRAGYYRSLVSANHDFNHERGLYQGFDAQRLLGSGVEDDGAEAVVRALLMDVRERPDRWLLYAVMNDPQDPYEPPRDMIRDLGWVEGAPLPQLTHIWVGRVRAGRVVPSEDELDYVKRLYRGELQVVDRALGELVQALRESGRLDAAIIVVVGIHGEEFYEHLGAGHGHTLFEESLRVPLFIRAPELLAPGRVEVPVDLLDLAPTLADVIGVGIPSHWQGESLLPVIDDPQPPPRLVVAYLGDGGRAAIVGDHKLIVGPGQRERYFDLGEDPKESTDLVAAGGVGLRMVRSALAWQLAHESEWRRARWGTGANLRSAFALDHGM